MVSKADDFEKKRIIQEYVPGKQVTLAHIIASPVQDIYERLGIEEKGAIGIATLTPCETAIIAADIATKTSEVEIGFLDRFTGSLVISGDVASVEEAMQAINETLEKLLGFTPAKITRT
ncbi:ethanolamine utilization microcompartment protein EutS [Desulforamulus hydrothermalis]|uniref:Putative carboxysome-like ethanolaminosome structural protein with putative role in ethanol utilization n=1 Tax=Desulforamulus hydrothermalis Lam5 = DSM 18033 TaxID=1121428 RepID=K8DY81_9FIRM|nr:BMC domain-containing protein [Desulforamulus hydrothermalis]CCO07719.1 putative carboxysome-like ethanolaminosome structural protein with putative role in ethanol utilization [Desulforamulus hydrothermalis Lam5 = DSM 18033]SHH33708.1 ethanolamine utilization protein EutS [Desulforamulus hydrothermalis Lam5 = DSM 18033]